MTAPLPWWRPEVHASRRPRLHARARIVSALRRWFERQGFVEVDCAALQVSPGNETHLHAFATERVGPDGARDALFLHTSPEFAAKKLLAAGETRIVAFSRVFRNREAGRLHASEFTMLEWYRAGAPYEAAMEDCASLLAVAAEAAGARAFRHGGREAAAEAAPERLAVADAFTAHAGIDLLATLGQDGTGDAAALAAQAKAAGLRTAPDDTWSDVFSRILVERVEPRLGIGRPVLLHDYPVPEAALARRKPSDPRLAERFELYVCGVEVANGFGELTDAAEQRARFEADMEEKARLYGERYPIDEDFLAALASMPEAAGVALGLDRLVMLALDAPDIEAVTWTPVARTGAGARA